MRRVSHFNSWLRLAPYCAAVATLFAVLTLAPALSFAQEVTAAITGRVTDPTGAAIAGAKVTATDTQRGTTWPTVTNSDGIYNLPRVPVGTYNVKVETQGFQTSQQSNVTLVLNQTARMDFQLHVGGPHPADRIDATGAGDRCANEYRTTVSDPQLRAIDAACCGHGPPRSVQL